MRVTEFSPNQVAVGRELGSGSFGIVYEGSLETQDGEEVPVVLKKARATADGEHPLTLRARPLFFFFFECGDNAAAD